MIPDLKKAWRRFHRENDRLKLQSGWLYSAAGLKEEPRALVWLEKKIPFSLYTFPTALRELLRPVSDSVYDPVMRDYPVPDLISRLCDEVVPAGVHR